MKIQKFAPLFLLIHTVYVHAAENALARVEQWYTKYPTPEARTECEKKNKEVIAAFDKEK